MRLCLFGARLFSAYSILIWIRIIMSWFVRYPERNSFTYYMGKMVDPYLNAFRKKGTTVGMLDFSPILAIGLLFVFESVLSIYGTYGSIQVSTILYIFLTAFWRYGINIYFWILVFTLIFQTIASFSSNPMRRSMAYAMDSASRPVTDFVKSIMGNRILPEKTINVISLLLTLVVWFISSYVFQYVASLVFRLGF